MTFYEKLEIHQSSTTTEIKQSYRRLAKKYHPDITNDDGTKFKEINEAYSVLSDTKKRAEYDMSLRVKSAPNFDMFNDFDAKFKTNLVIHRTINIGLKESYFGAKVRVEIYSNEIIDIDIPAGIMTNQRIVVEGKGTRGRNSKGMYVYGDLIITVVVQPDKQVRQIDLLDLETTVNIDTFRMFKDFDFEVKLWDTSLGKVKITKDMDITKRIRIKGKGMKHRTFNSVGDLYVKINPVVPNFDELPKELQDSINNYISNMGE